MDVTQLASKYTRDEFRSLMQQGAVLDLDRVPDYLRITAVNYEIGKLRAEDAAEFTREAVARARAAKQATKHDNGKPRLDLLPPEALIEIANVFTHGAARYGDHNWRQGLPHSRTIAAALRHIMAFQGGADIDNGEGGTNCHHLACAIVELMFALTFEIEALHGTQVPEPYDADDRFHGREVL